MNAPIREFVERYAASGAARLHMPGHKGVGPLGCEAFDITEIAGADALYEAEGIIAESEANATALFETQRTLYATEGSSQCIRAMLYLAMTAWMQDRRVSAREAADAHPEGARGEALQPFASTRETLVCSGSRPVALAGRNAHRAFLTAAALCDFDVEWLWPEAETASPCACPISAEGLRRALDAMERPPFCVYVTSPDYLGGMLDIAALAEVCHACGVPLLVDNAHGAYLKFLPEKLHPMELGADLCCDSAHKTLPVLTGGAYLHVGRSADARYARRAKQALALFGSTSPSYLILQSLDCANPELADCFPARLAECRARVDALKAKLAARGFAVLPSEPMKLTLRTDGPEVARLLREGANIFQSVSKNSLISDQSLSVSSYSEPKSVIIESSQAPGSALWRGVEPEFVDREHVVLMFSPGNSADDFECVARALIAPPTFEPIPSPAFPIPPRAMRIRDAMFAPSERVPIERAAGRICADPMAPCPPAISVINPGERVTAELAEALRRRGIEALTVVREEFSPG